ncbi:MAG TPA: hypothetical protein VGC04_01670 [Cellulomonas sp.]
MARSSWNRVRGITAAVLIVVGLVLTPVAMVAAHARTQLTDTDRFVATFAPLASDRGVQDAVGDAAIAAVDSTVDFSALAALAIQGLPDSTPPAVTGLLALLGDRAASALRSIVDEQIRSVVGSDAFPQLWEQMLRVAHSRVVAGVQADASASLVLRGDTVVLQVGPIVERARQLLVDRGSQFASRIPPVNRTVDLVEVPGLSTAATSYGAVVALGVWLPVAAALLVVVGVVLARRRRVTVLRTGLGLAGVAVVVLVALAVVRAVLMTPAHEVSTAALDRSRALLLTAAYDAATGGVVRTTAIALVVGVVAAVAAHLLGRLAAPAGALGAVEEARFIS